MRFPPDLLDEIRARLPVSQVVGRRVALKRAGRELRGLSPFKVEKTPSFFVNDQKGAWFDFSSGEAGDIFKFVMLTDGLSFAEAVERLAEEAGVPIPKRPADEGQENERDRLYEVLKAAKDFFKLQLARTASARAYLKSRDADGVAHLFELGYAPDSRSALKEHLAKAGFTAKEMVASGMLVAGEDVPVPYDRFRDRLMFPITDLKGRVIAFGGRALSSEASAKYLNSPETPLFCKGSVLFNAFSARKPAYDKGQIIVVEGYMDVVALVRAGFPYSVATLGTALTSDQLRLLWRLVPEPVLCFDGDAAGRRAAFRAVERVLPHLKPGFSVRFAFLPAGLDPDDFVRQYGAEAFQEILDKRTTALFDVLMEREERREEAALTPERRASTEARLRALVATIADRSVRLQYERELRETLYAKHRRAIREIAASDGRRAPWAAGKRRANAQPDWRLSARAVERSRLGRLPRAATLEPPPMRSNELAEHPFTVPSGEALLITTLLDHPWLIDRHLEQIAELTFTSKPLERLRDALLECLACNISLDRQAIRAQLSNSGLDKVIALAERAIPPRSEKFAEPCASAADVEAGWQHAVALHESQAGLKCALEAAEQAWRAHGNEDAWRRILEIRQQLAQGYGEHIACGAD
jgi:DNA primase